MIFENKPQLGLGIYTPAEIAQILRLPYYKVNRWIDKYWDGELGQEFEKRYSWKTDKSKAVSFHTLVEFYVMMQLADAGVKTRKVLEAHKELSQFYNTSFPFALREVLDGVNTDGKRIFLSVDDYTITLDGTKQFNLGFIKVFFKKLEFDSNNLASRLWPLGKEKSVLIDPERKFGHPVLEMKNIFPETIYGHYKAGDPIEYISYVYKVTEKEVRDAIEFIDAA
jgi:uncharacterized protein (DUF433 family)